VNVPHDLDAEKAVLGGLMLGGAADGLASADFHRPAHQLIFEAIEALRAAGKPVGAIAAADELRRRGALSRIGGGPYLHTLLEAAPSAAQTGHYAGIVRELAERRAILEQAHRAIQAAGNPAVDIARAREYVGTKKEERTKPAGPQVPSADPAMYAGICGEIAVTAAPTTEADPVGIYASVLAGTGVLVGGVPYVQIGNTRHPLLIWPLLMGRTGAGRKGEATGTGEVFLRTARDMDMAELTVSGLSSGEGLIERISDDETQDKRLLVIETEFTSVMARSRREGSTLGQVQRQAWEGRALAVLNRKQRDKKQLRASSSHVAVIGHITPREFRLALAETDLSGGTYNRYLPLFVERTRLLPIPEGVSSDDRIRLGARLGEAIDQAAAIERIQLNGEATELWKAELYPEMTGADDEDHAEAEFTRRAAPYCLRIGGLLAALDGRRLIGKDDLTAAAALVRYSIASARYVLDGQARDPRLERIRRAVDAAGDDGLNRSAIWGLFSRNLTKEVLAELLAQLTASGDYEEVREATKGRPAETFRRVLSS
jgi:hypothetical protein